MENKEVLADLKFRDLEGTRYYYLFNWRMNKKLDPKDIGMILY